MITKQLENQLKRASMLLERTDQEERNETATPKSRKRKKEDIEDEESQLQLDFGNPCTDSYSTDTTGSPADSSDSEQSTNELEALKKRLLREYDVNESWSNTQWLVSFLKLKAFYMEHGHANVGYPRSELFPGQYSMYNWVLFQKRKSRKMTLDQWRRDLLQEIEVDLGSQQPNVPRRPAPTNKKQMKCQAKRVDKPKPKKQKTPSGRYWDRMFPLLLKFHGIHGHCRVFRSIDGGKWNELATWVYEMRRRYKNGSILEPQITALEQLDFEWDRANCRDAEWERVCSLWEQYMNDKGSIPAEDCIVDGVNLSDWARSQQVAIQRNQLKLERRKRLEEIGFVSK